MSLQTKYSQVFRTGHSKKSSIGKAGEAIKCKVIRGFSAQMIPVKRGKK